MKQLLQFGWLTKVYVWKRSGPSNVILHRFCLTKGSTLISQGHYSNYWFMYQNRLGPSGGIYYPSFVPCFVYHQLNGIFYVPLCSRMRNVHCLQSGLVFSSFSLMQYDYGQTFQFPSKNYEVFLPFLNQRKSDSEA